MVSFDAFLLLSTSNILFYYAPFVIIAEFKFSQRLKNNFLLIFPHISFAADKLIHNLTSLDKPTRQTLKCGALSGVGWLWWGRSRLRYKSPEFKKCFGNTLLYATSVRNFLRPQCGVFGNVLFDITLRSALVVFIILCGCDYYNMKGPIYYVLTFHNQ